MRFPQWLRSWVLLYRKQKFSSCSHKLRSTYVPGMVPFAFHTVLFSPRYHLPGHGVYYFPHLLLKNLKLGVYKECTQAHTTRKEGYQGRKAPGSKHRLWACLENVGMAAKHQEKTKTRQKMVQEQKTGKNSKIKYGKRVLVIFTFFWGLGRRGDMLYVAPGSIVSWGERK